MRTRLRAKAAAPARPHESSVPREYSVKYSAEYSRVQTDRARLLVRDAYAKALSDDVDVAKLRAWRAAQVGLSRMHNICICMQPCIHIIHIDAQAYAQRAWRAAQACAAA